MNIFVRLGQYSLFIDRILFEGRHPILFSCVNSVNQHFICVRCKDDSTGVKWLLREVDLNNIVKMLKNEMTIRDLFLSGDSLKISINLPSNLCSNETVSNESYFNNRYEFEYNNSDWDEDSVYLPKKDEYIEAEQGEFEEDIEYYEECLRVNRENNGCPLVFFTSQPDKEKALDYKKISCLSTSVVNQSIKSVMVLNDKRIDFNFDDKAILLIA